MPPKASDARRPNAGSKGGANNSSTLNADGQPKRKRTRGRGGRGRGGRGKKDSSDESSSSDDDSSDDDDDGDDAKEQPVASTSKIATTSSPAKLKTAALKSVAKGKATEEASTDEDSDDDGSLSDSSSSFLTTSDEDDEVPTPRARPSQTQQGSIADESTYAQSQYDTFQSQNQPQSAAAVSKRPEMARPNDPPYIQFGADADATSNIRAFGKPILWGLLPGDVPSTSSPSLNDDENEEQDERMKVIIEQEKVKAEERYSKFREDYVSKMITRFGASLDQIRVKEGDTMKESRLKVLIDSIALGADTFTSKNGEGIWKVKNGMGEREVVLEGLEMLESKQTEDEEMED